MGETRHEKSFVDFERTYEHNVIGLKGIVWFGVGLFLLIVITFGLMWALLNVLEDNAREEKSSDNPMMRRDLENLPPEPRLQSAPGFGVDSAEGRVNLELTAPQSEYWELKRQWDILIEKGEKHPGTGTMIALPVEEGKQRLLGQGVKARSGTDAGASADASRMYISDSSSGRIASEKRR